LIVAMSSAVLKCSAQPKRNISFQTVEQNPPADW